jgi:hypothetical protein
LRPFMVGDLSRSQLIETLLSMTISTLPDA